MAVPAVLGTVMALAAFTYSTPRITPSPARPVTGPTRTAGTYSVVRIGSCRARGDFAVCIASGNVNHPASIHVHVVARPGQRVSGSWTMVCSKGNGAGGKSGNFSGWASAKHPLRRDLRMPYLHPDSCTVSASAQLSKSGRLHVWLTARH